MQPGFDKLSLTAFNFKTAGVIGVGLQQHFQVHRAQRYGEAKFFQD